MVANSAMDTKRFSREEHVERVDLWKKVERFMAGWSAAEMPRRSVRSCGLTPCGENTTVAIISDYLFSHFRIAIWYTIPVISDLWERRCIRDDPRQKADV